MNQKGKYVLVGVILASFVTMMQFQNKNYASGSSNINQARQELANLEKLDVNEIEKKIEEKNKPAVVEEEVQVTANTNIDFKKYFENSVFMGDSITEALSEYAYLDPYNVLAKKGQTVVMAKQSIPNLKAMHPARVFLLYGMNDVESYDSVYFKQQYTQLISQIKAVLPSTQIYVQAPFPVLSKAVFSGKMLTNDNINKFRQAVKEMCDEQNVKYVDVTVLVKDNTMYEPDGIHFKYDFYKTYLTYMHDIINK